MTVAVIKQTRKLKSVRGAELQTTDRVQALCSSWTALECAPHNLNAHCCYSTQTGERKITHLQYFITGFCNHQLCCCWHGLDNLIYQLILDLHTSDLRMHWDKNSALSLLSQCSLKTKSIWNISKLLSFHIKKIKQAKFSQCFSDNLEPA